MDSFSLEERAVASAVAALGGSWNKREREDSPDAAGGTVKKVKTVDAMDEAPIAPAAPAIGPERPPAELERVEEEPKPYPFFHYKDFSKEVDPDPLTPLTPPGRVPNFPAKMHSILSRPDLADIVCWMPHGRSWRVLKPREFEVKVIPTYFEHAKFSSFIRQANGWGFRRITQGRDRNSYYHELFLRGLPHLCKKMKRPGVAEKQAADPDHEPDLYKISEAHPVPEKAEDDSILLQCTLEGGPKARMPIYSGSFTSSLKEDMSLSFLETKPAPLSASIPSLEAKPAPLPAPILPTAAHKLNPHDEETLSAFQKALGASEQQFNKLNLSLTSPAPAPVSLPAPAFAATNQLPLNFQVGAQNKISPLAAANQLAFATTNFSPSTHAPGNLPNVAAALESAHAASQFAAGFAAAAALSQQHFRNMLGSLAVMQPQSSSAQQPPNASQINNLFPRMN